MKILIISGVHGNEVSAVEVGMKLAEIYKDTEEIEIIPWANYSGLIAGTREMSPSSTRDLNRSFVPYEENYVDKLKIAIDKADFVIDIHNSPRCAHFALLDINNKEQRLSNLCKHSGIEYGSRYSNGETIKDYVNCQEEKLAITYEFPGMSTYNNSDNISRALVEVQNLVSTIQENTWEKHYREDHAELHRIEELHDSSSGFVEVLKDVNEIVQPRELIYRIRDSKNNIISSGHNYDGERIKILAMGPSMVKKGSQIGMYIRI